MKEHLLFIDTEASGLPKNWGLYYDAPGNWPHMVQVSWIIYNKEGKKIKEQNYFVNNNDFEISAGAERVHGITKSFLRQNGIPRNKLLIILSTDLIQYQPMVVGHFMELDYRVVGMDYYREKMYNPMEDLPVFCIMKASQHLQQNPQSKFLRLGQLYELLFKKPLLSQHNAMTDATATADCFFELVRRNEITSFVQPPVLFQTGKKTVGIAAWIIALLLVLFSIVLLIFCYG